MSHEVKLEYKTEDVTAAPATPLPVLKSEAMMGAEQQQHYGGGHKMDVDDDALDEPGAMYMCANCTALLRLTASSVLQCPNCEHITGSSSVFYKYCNMQSRAPATPTTSAANTSRGGASTTTTTTTATATATLPQCICATCYTAMPLPRPSLTSLPFQCPQCRLNGADGKVLYTRRAFPTEHSTR